VDYSTTDFVFTLDGGGQPASSGRSDRLSAREKDVLGGLANGSSTEEIGVTLTMSPHTVRTHLRNIMRKLDANTRAHAVAIALSDGAIDPPR
jgi:DNA-binding CsgD family transcriptional regulator